MITCVTFCTSRGSKALLNSVLFTDCLRNSKKNVHDIGIKEFIGSVYLSSGIMCLLNVSSRGTSVIY